MRLLLTQRGCPHCNEAIKVINKFNLKLPMEERVRIVDLGSWEEFGLDDNPIRTILGREHFSGYPTFYLDGILIEPFPTREQFKIFLETYFQNKI